MCLSVCGLVCQCVHVCLLMFDGNRLCLFVPPGRTLTMNADHRPVCVCVRICVGGGVCAGAASVAAGHSPEPPSPKTNCVERCSV